MLDYISKLWFALNSAQKNWSLALALSLGAVAGSIPMINVVHFFILIFALLVQIHFGFFILATSVFMLLSYFLDPLFHDVGLLVLQSDMLQNFFTSLYNMPYMKLTNFNNTVVMGSVVLSLLAFPVLYMLMSMFVKAYREKIARFLHKVPFVKHLGVYNEQAAAEEENTVFRWWALGLFVSFSGAFLIVVIFFMDSFIKIGLERSLSFFTNKTVEIDYLHTDVFASKMDIGSIKFLDETQEKAEIEIYKVGMVFDVEKALEKKVLIDFLKLEGIRFNTPILQENSPKALSKKEVIDQQKRQSSGFSMLSALKFPNVASLLKKEKLETVEHIQKLQVEARELKNAYSMLQEAFKQGDVAKNEQAIKELVQKAKQVRTPEGFIHLREDYNALKKELLAKLQKIEEEKKSLQTRFAKLSTQLQELEHLPQQEFERLSSKYSFDSNGAFNVIGTVAGEKTKLYLEQLHSFYEFIKPHLKSAKEPTEREVKVRAGGVFVSFKQTKPSPDFYVKRTIFDIKHKNNLFKGVIYALSSNQFITQKPSVLTLNASGKDFKQLHVYALYDSIEGEASADINVQAINLQDFRLGEVILKSAKANVLSNLFVDTKSVLLELSSTVDKAHLITSIQSQSLRQVLKRADAFRVEASANMQDDIIKTYASSDLDKVLVASLKKELEAKETAFKIQLKKRLQILIAKEVKMLETEKISLKEQDKNIASGIKALEHFSQKAFEDIKYSQLKQLEDKGVEKLKKLFSF